MTRMPHISKSEYKLRIAIILRGWHKLVVPPFNTYCMKNSVALRGPIIWNGLNAIVSETVVNSTGKEDYDVRLVFFDSHSTEVKLCTIILYFFFFY